MDKVKFAAEFVEELPNYAARTLENLHAQEVSAFVDEIPDPLSSKALRYMLPHHAARCLRALPVANSVRYLTPLPVSNIANILRHLPQSVSQEILEQLPHKVTIRVRRLLIFPRTVVGAWTNVDAIALPADCTRAEALRRIRQDVGDAPAEVFIVDDDHRLIGKIWIGALVSERAARRLEDFLTPVAHVLSATSSLQAAVGNIGWQDLDALPVVDRADLFIGTLRYRELRRALAGIMADRAGAANGSAALGMTNSWFNGLAAILDVVLARSGGQVTH